MPVLNPKKWSLAVKFSLTFIFVVAFVGFLVGAVMVVQEWSRSHEVLGEKALLLSESIAKIAPKAILRKDFWALYQSLKNIGSGKQDISSAMILDADGIILAHLDPANNPLGQVFIPQGQKENMIHQQVLESREPIIISIGGFDQDSFQEGVAPIFSDQKYLGVVRVTLSVAQIYEETWSTVFLVIVMVFFFVMVGSALGIIISRQMVKPLAQVTNGLEAVGRGEMSDFIRVSNNSGDEIDRLSHTFNQIMIELAEKKQLEDEIAMSQKLVALGRITAGVAHEVNNPLAGLLNCIDTLRSHPDNPKLIERYLPIIDQGLHRIKDIVQNLLVGLKVEEGEEIVELDHINKLHYLIKAEIGDRAITIDWNNELAPEVPVSAKLEQIVFNLLKNSIEALGEEGLINVRIYTEGEYLTVQVKDNGPGIPINIKNQLFDPFFTTKSNGTGLGLWVVYRQTQSLKGIIEFECDETGTSFYVTVPVVTRKVA